MNEAPAHKRKALAALLPTPTAEQWAVVLHFESDYSDKEYRVIVDHVKTIFQWGRSGADGETKVAFHGTPDAAGAAARKQWAAKEAKGYWPISGVLLGTPGWVSTTGAWQLRPVSVLNRAITTATHALTGCKPGTNLVLVQASRRGAGTPLAYDTLVRLSAVPRHTPVTPGEFVVVAVDDTSIPLLAQLYPVVVPIGSRTNDDDRAVGQIAATLADDFTGDTSRVRLDRALEAARLLV